MSIESIQLDKVSKRFRLGATNEYGRLTEAIATGVKNLFRKSPTRRPFGDLIPLRIGSKRVGFGHCATSSFPSNPEKSLALSGAMVRQKHTVENFARIVTPTQGRVGVRGRVGSLLEVGTGFHPELTGRENVFLNGAILGMPRAEIRKRFDEIVAFAEIESFLETPVKRYSSGMAVRLAFAVAAHLERMF